MKNYFAILELDETATGDDVRRAYRRLVKLYHPDAGGSEEDQGRFIEITEAYDYLVDPARRRRHAAYLVHRQTHTYTPAAREADYKAWVQREEMLARVRMKRKQQQMEEEAFKRSLAYKVLRGVNKIYNILFLIFCTAVISIPIYKYFHQDDVPAVQQDTLAGILIPVVVGLGFSVVGYYYLFILKTDEH